MRHAYNININDQILLKGSSKKFMKFNLDVEIKYGHCFLILLEEETEVSRENHRPVASQ
jgi:hypothetical protein